MINDDYYYVDNGKKNHPYHKQRTHARRKSVQKFNGETRKKKTLPLANNPIRSE